MKTLVFIRHAKSDKKSKKIRDIERPLSKRGLKEAPIMGKVLKNLQLVPDLILSSPATRAMKTAELIAKEFEINTENIISDSNLYLESKSTLLSVIKHIDDKYNTVFLVSHNPGLTDLVNYLSIETIKNVPTSGSLAIEVDTETWSELDMGNGKLLFHEYPKKHREETAKSEGLVA